jgi:putative addiction module component (TIGR02574 family)
MSLEQIEDKALQLSEGDRAKLAQKLLLSLDTLSESELADDWLIEAQRRARELDEGTVQPISAEEVRREASDFSCIAKHKERLC